jgi:hypothetical protein
MSPIEGTEERIDCDGLILSVGLIPENELAKSMNVKIDARTKGPIVDQNMMSMEDGIFSCGNALHVNDLVDYVSESAEIAARNAVSYVNKLNRRNSYKRKMLDIRYSNDDFLYVVPQKIDMEHLEKACLYFRSREVTNNRMLVIREDGNVLIKKKYTKLKPPEMERLEIKLAELLHEKNNSSNLDIELRYTND